MTATITQQSQQQQLGVFEKEWTKLFPEQVTENYTSSATFVKQLTSIAVSTITYLKNAFPEDSYTCEQFAGLRLKLLKRKCCDELAQFVSTTLEQAFDAFDKKYVHQLALCFYEGECKADNLLEYHVFEYSYTADGIQMNINSKNRDSRREQKCTLANVKFRTTTLIRALSMYAMQASQQALPVNYDVSVRLYYNDDAPENYQAPGFRASSDEDHLSSTASDAVLLGVVETPYHKMSARSFVRDPDPVSDQAMASDNAPEMTQADRDDFQGPLSPASSGSGSEAGAAGEVREVGEVGEVREAGDARVRCPCGRQDSADQTLLTCQYCHSQQHAACFGLLTAAAAGGEHCCSRCAARDRARRPTDPDLLGLEPRRRECLCLFRRTLALCARGPAVAGATLMRVLALSEASAAKMLRLLRSHRILMPNIDVNDLAAPRKISPVQLELTFKRFFQMQDEDNIAERLAAESESAPTRDPVGEVLSPMEMITLRNTSNLGAVIEKPSDANQVVDDPTLQKYREAILTNETITEELPLSGSHNPVKDVEKIGKKKLKRKTDASDEEWLPKMPKLRSGTKTKKKLYDFEPV